MASSSSSSQQSRYQVFLSFRGEDTRHNFTSHLLKALKGRGISVFFDEEKLEKGRELSPALLKAIAASKVSIVILSKDYASSKSCLTELSKIMECKLTQGQDVLPIFYKVNPSDVRHQTGSFEEPFNQHLRKKPEEVENWKAAFTQAGNLTGWHIDGGIFDRSEPEYIEDIVKAVTNKLGINSVNMSKDLVGIDHQMEHIAQLIEQEKVRMIGIWGMGGIGKTTLADAVYNKVLSPSDKFDAHYFLHNVRERSLETYRLQALRDKLLSKLLKEKIEIDTPLIPTLIQDRLSSLRVLVVLDDVDKLDQTKCLGVEYFGVGSKIIVTSRDRQVLLNIGVDFCHGINVLSEDNSLQLFSKHAFKQDNPIAGVQDLVMKFVGYGGGIPLAPKVLGAALFGKSRREWEGAWDKLQEYPEKDIFGPLKISYNGLGDLEKNIFLDIACFHIGEHKDYVQEILECCYKGVEFGIGNLVDKCLLEVENSHWYFKMHDLLQEMGRDIARQERNRLWSPEDVCYVLKNNKDTFDYKGIESIKGISLKMDPIEAVYICPSAFEKMVDLEFIRFYGRELIEFYPGEFGGQNKLLLLNQKLTYLPNALRYFHWNDCPLKSLPSTFNPRKLVKLSLQNSNIEQLWDGNEDVVNLRAVDVRGCKNLRKIPNLLGATKLEKLICERCESLVEIPEIQTNRTLEIDVEYCESLKSLLGLPSIGDLRAGGCTSLESVSFIDRDPGDLKDACIFDFRNCSKLSEDALNNIIAVYPMIISPSDAKRFAKRLKEGKQVEEGKQKRKFGVISYLPEIREISDKFENQKRNSSIIVKLGPATSKRFLCFALCLVLGFDKFFSHSGFYVDCKYRLKGGIDGEKNFQLTFESPDTYLGFGFTYDNGHRLCILLGEIMVHRDMQYTTASFAFRVRDDFFNLNFTSTVEKCGVHVFYVDADSFAVSHVVSSIDFSSDGPDTDFSSDGLDTDFSSDEDTSCDEDDNVENDHYNPALTNDESLNAFSIDFSSHENIRSCSPCRLSLGVEGLVVEEDDYVEKDHDDPARTTLGPKRILSSNGEGDHPDKRLKTPYSC